MGKRSRLLLAVAFAVGAAAQQAEAAVITMTGGVLGLTIGALPPIRFGCGGQDPAGSDPVAECTPAVEITVSDPGTGQVGFVEPAGLFTGTVMLPTALFTGVALINGLTVANLSNSTKVVAPGAGAGPRTEKVLRAGGGLGGPGPITGTAFVNVLGLFNLEVPLNVIGNTGATTSVAAGSLNVTVAGTGWTTGGVVITAITTTPPGQETAINTVTFVGYDNRNANGTGVVQIIAPFHITTNAAGNLPGLATQTLTFIPEPGTILMLLSGTATLGLGGWLRMRRK